MELSVSHPFHFRYFGSAVCLALVAACLSGCQSKQNAAIEQAKKQAAATGQPQQISSTDKNGNTVTTVVEPPVAGQTGQVVTTTVTPKASAGQSGAQADATASSPSNASSGQNPGPTADQPQAPPAPAPQIHVTKGTALVIRINERLSAKESHKGERFSGEVAEPVLDGNGAEIIPKKTPVRGVVELAKARGDFKGAADLELRLTSLTLRGKEYPLDTHDVLRTKKGKGKRTGAFVGGGTGLGLLLGGIAGGGRGALIGGLAGAGAGTVGAGATGNSDLVIPAESIVHFKLKDDLVIEP